MKNKSPDLGFKLLLKIFALFLSGSLFCFSAVADETKSPTPEPSSSATPQVFIGHLTQLELTPPINESVALSLNPVELPKDLGKKVLESDQTTRAWTIPIGIKANDEKISGFILEGRKYDFNQNQARPAVTVLAGNYDFPLTIVKMDGHVAVYRLKVSVVEEDQSQTDPDGFGLIGPAVYSEKITQSGMAIANPGSSSTLVGGVHGIYRRRVLRRISDLLPGHFAFFLDGAATIGKSLGGDPAAAGTPIWADAKASVAFNPSDTFRLEFGTGLSFFSSGLSQTTPGELEQFFSFVISGRVSHPITTNVLGLLGINFGFPTTNNSQQSSIVSQPFEVFGSASFPRGKTGFWEIRLRYFRVNTSGTVYGAGSFDGSQTIFGPEILWGLKL